MLRLEIHATPINIMQNYATADKYEELIKKFYNQLKDLMKSIKSNDPTIQ